MTVEGRGFKRSHTANCWGTGGVGEGEIALGWMRALRELPGELDVVVGEGAVGVEVEEGVAGMGAVGADGFGFFFFVSLGGDGVGVHPPGAANCAVTEVGGALEVDAFDDVDVAGEGGFDVAVLAEEFNDAPGVVEEAATGGDEALRLIFDGAGAAVEEDDAHAEDGDVGHDDDGTSGVVGFECFEFLFEPGELFVVKAAAVAALVVADGVEGDKLPGADGLGGVELALADVVLEPGLAVVEGVGVGGAVGLFPIEDVVVASGGDDRHMLGGLAEHLLDQGHLAFGDVAGDAGVVEGVATLEDKVDLLVEGVLDGGFEALGGVAAVHEVHVGEVRDPQGAAGREGGGFGDDRGSRGGGEKTGGEKAG